MAAVGTQVVGLATSRDAVPASLAGTAQFASGLTDDFKGAVTVEEGGLLVAVSGRETGREEVLRLFELRDRSWRPAPAPATTIDGGSPLLLRSNGRRTCFASQKRGALTLACRDLGGPWKTIDIKPRPKTALLPVGIETGPSGLLLVARSGMTLRTLDISRSVARLAASDRVIGRRLVATGRIGRAPALALRSSRPPTSITLLRLAGRAWVQHGPPLKTAGIGPLLGGPQTLNGAPAIAVTSARGRAWPLTVATLRGRRWTTSAPVNQGSGDAQGALFGTAAGTVLLWQQQAGSGKNGFVSSVWLRQGASGPARSLWKARSIGPGILDVVSVDKTLVTLSSKPHGELDDKLRVALDITKPKR